jgi:hypothetical protein
MGALQISRNKKRELAAFLLTLIIGEAHAQALLPIAGEFVDSGLQ